MLAPTLPADGGFTPSIWASLTPDARELFLQEVLVLDPRLELTGSVDFASDREPLLLDPAIGGFVSLAGEAVAAAPGGLVVDVTQGTFIDRAPLLLAAVGVAALLFILAKS